MNSIKLFLIRFIKYILIVLNLLFKWMPFLINVLTKIENDLKKID